MIIQPRIYLASQSPRRRELLKQIGVNFEMLLLRSDPRRSIDVDESPYEGESPEDYVRRVSKAKAQFGWDGLRLRNLPAFPVLAADTCVTLDGKIIGKPGNRGEATAILRQLSGRQHEVLSAVAVTFDEYMEVRLSRSRITFSVLTEERIMRYVITNEPLDKAGAYGIQGYGAAFIQHMEGSYSGVMGLPLFETTELLKTFGYPVL